MMNAMLLSSGLPQNMWEEDVLSANYLLNKVPRKKEDKSPYELLKGRKSSYKYLRVWGCLAKVAVPTTKKKLNLKASKKPTSEHVPPVASFLASKPVTTDTTCDPLLDHMMSVPREYPMLSEPVQPVFDPVPHNHPDPNCHENVEVPVPTDTASSIQLGGHQQGHFRRNSSEDLVGLGERQESDGFTTVQRKKSSKGVDIPRLSLRVTRSQAVYASCSPAGRRDLWMGLHQISLVVDGLWMVGGNFNVIAHNGERTGHNTRDRGTSDFADMMMDCGLTDAGYSGSQYTWTNGRVWKWLDRVLIKSSVGSSCSRFSVRHLNRSTSDHSPLLIQ
ncbi:Pol polyprotein [Abeliophyllum distichum]|uniref:Pol polyprotein n=1 Tax=Abeliophyllum distichum TaxID=126358 RepID=A0ABD1NNM3_9LAMI